MQQQQQRAGSTVRQQHLQFRQQLSKCHKNYFGFMFEPNSNLFNNETSFYFLCHVYMLQLHVCSSGESAKAAREGGSRQAELQQENTKLERKITKLLHAWQPFCLQIRAKRYNGCASKFQSCHAHTCGRTKKKQEKTLKFAGHKSCLSRSI